MENTQINKIKFFAQYWGQRVWRRTQGENNLLYINTDTLSAKRGNMNGDFLELKPLSSITDEDAIEVGDIMDFETSTREDIDFVKSCIDSIINGDQAQVLAWVQIFDYLRSKGYALPWMGLSVEEQISRGWIKLKTE